MTEEKSGQAKPASHQQITTELFKNENLKIIGQPQYILVPVVREGEKPEERPHTPLSVAFCRGEESGIYCFVLQIVDPMKPDTAFRMVEKRSNIFFDFDRIAATLIDHGCPITGKADIEGIRSALEGLAVIRSFNAPQKAAEEKPAEAPQQK